MSEAVLERLGLDDRPSVDPDGLAALYEAWGQHVPWDCVRKRLYFSSACDGPLPGSTPEDFFASWLEHGTGGTCWAGSIALRALLESLGFEARFGAGQVQVEHDSPLMPIPSHGTTIVRFGDDDVIVDSSFLTREPLPLVDDRRTFRFAPFHDAGGKFWRIVLDAVPGEMVDAWHEATRATSPFNRFLNARRNDGDEVVGWSFGHGVRLRSDGTVEHDEGGRKPWLVEVLGFSEEIVDRLPDDEAA
ncbi:MAG TPA: arylamine N-acetyltransferase [Acidimicrobiales bacterium]|nr:arylamine N-acetyltransferase [Acidimicrobiales bacterium]